MTWRVGHRVPLNVYDGDRPVCQCHTPEDAARIVAAVNAGERSALRLSDAVESEGYRFRAGDWRNLIALGAPAPDSDVAICAPHQIVCPNDSWDYAYSAAHEIAEHRNSFTHSVETFSEQANILARWLKMAATSQPEGDRSGTGSAPDPVRLIISGNWPDSDRRCWVRDAYLGEPAKAPEPATQTAVRVLDNRAEEYRQAGDLHSMHRVCDVTRALVEGGPVRPPETNEDHSE